ncbi:hypothetical protein GCM10011507_22130 [Edaphobacter acidisoli]|uniref:Uncharacterized protein n=1 Tax=Edaphobacter acidisoli TaxID=2040573 RepID=A0A916W666_9BACT|nr:hypothetical protein GCM10011507_22130 [Edaphobacter acidisoli]
MNPEPAGKLLLAQSGCNAQQPQNARILWREVQNFESFSKLRGGMRPKLGEQKRRSWFIYPVAVHRENNDCTNNSFIV